MSNFSYELAMRMPREVVLKHFRMATQGSISQAVKRFSENGRQDIADFIVGCRDEIRIERMTAAIEAKASA